jgi:hypothetical protein
MTNIVKCGDGKEIFAGWNNPTSGPFKRDVNLAGQTTGLFQIQVKTKARKL